MSKEYLIEAIIPVIKVFDQLNIAYYISGSVASSAYGKSRATMDVDCVSTLSLDKAHSFAEILKEDYYADEDAIRQAIKQNSSFNLIHLKTMFKIDVFIARREPYEQEALKRRRKDSLDDREDIPKVYIATPEDAILSKLEWFQKGGRSSEKQWGDILGILKVQDKQLDLDYLKNWAEELGLLDLLNKALSES